jgi:pilus assembly protein Flp/PilA
MRRVNPTAQVRRFLPAQDGATAIEYALIASSIAGVLVVSITNIGGKITVMWTAVANLLH